MSILCFYGRMTDLPVSDCAEVRQSIVKLKAETARPVLDAEVDVIATKLIDQLNSASTLANKLKNAANTSQRDLVLSAVGGATSLLFELAIYSGNPNLIAGSAAVKIITDATTFGIQMAQTDSTGGMPILLNFVKDRAAFYFALAGTAATKSVMEKTLSLGSTIQSVGFQTTEAAITWATVKAEAHRAASQLDQLKAAYAPVLIGRSQTRDYRLAMIEGQLRYLEMIQSVYLANGCRAPNLVPVRPPVLP